MKLGYIIAMGVALTAAPAAAQTGIGYAEFEKRVLEYSQTLKQSQAQQKAMRKAMQAAKTAFFPAVDANGSYQYRINDYDMEFGGMGVPMEHDSYSAEVGVVQPVYAGGSIYHGYKAAQIQSDIANESVALTTDNIILSAESGYWKAVAQKELYQTMCHYVDIITQLTEVLQNKYDDGIISKTDLLQMQARLAEAKLQRSGSLQAYEIAMQNLNVMMGAAPNDSLALADSLATACVIPAPMDGASALSLRPDYRISQLNVAYQKRQVKLATAKYNPSLSVGFKETWGTQMLNISGETMFNSLVFVSLKIPLFHWGARFKAKATQKAILMGQEYALQEKADRIQQEVAKAWTNISEYDKQIKLAQENCQLAEESLDINTFSYTEGKLTILDVLSAQLSWIQSYSSLIQARFNQRVAMAEYRKATGSRYLEQSSKSGIESKSKSESESESNQ